MHNQKVNSSSAQSLASVVDCFSIKKPSGLTARDFRKRPIHEWFVYYFAGIEQVDWEEYTAIHSRFFDTLLDATGKRSEFETMNDEECFGFDELAEMLTPSQQHRAWQSFLAGLGCGTSQDEFVTSLSARIQEALPNIDQDGFELLASCLRRYANESIDVVLFGR